jgi:transposase-like protein
MSQKTKNVATMDPTVVQEALTRQVAAVLLTGASVTDCAKQLSISPAAVRRIQASDKYKELVTETAESELAPALAKAKAQLARLSAKAVKAIEKALDEGSARDALQAATIVLRSVGLHEDEKQQQDTAITVIMPGATTEQVIEVQAEEEIPRSGAV